MEPSGEALNDILVEDCTFVNPRGYLLAVRNGSNLTFRRNKVVWDDPVCKGLPYAGKTLVEGGENNK